jgi:hypothetical protein
VLIGFDRWLYALIIVIDANFHLKLKEKGIMEDPALGDGWAHWVSMKPYHAYVRKYGYQVEVSGYLFFRSIFLPLVILYSPTFVTQN